MGTHGPQMPAKDLTFEERSTCDTPTCATIMGPSKPRGPLTARLTAFRTECYKQPYVRPGLSRVKSQG